MNVFDNGWYPELVFQIIVSSNGTDLEVVILYSGWYAQQLMLLVLMLLVLILLVLVLLVLVLLVPMG